MRIWNTLNMRGVKITRGEGCTVWDSEGRPYLDLQSGYWCNVLGYGDSAFVEPVRKQVSRLVNVMSAFRTGEVEAAMEELEKILPDELSRAAFLNSGSEAVDLALKMARAATGRSGMAVNEVGYYGATSYPLSLSGAGRGAAYLPDPGEVHRIPPPLCHTCEHGSRERCRNFECLGVLDSLVDEGCDSVAAVMYEPVCGAGILVPPIGYGARLREQADALSALLISEEVTTGVGRTGRWFGFQHDDIVPDILVLGKAIGGGFPVSVVATTGDVEDRCVGALRHVQSHQNDAFSGRVVHTVLSVIRERGLVERAAWMGERWLAAFKGLAGNSAVVEDVRGRGLMLGVQLGEEWEHLGVEVEERLIGEGFLVDFHRPSRTFRFFPPYVISEEETDSFVEAFGVALAAIK